LFIVYFGRGFIFTFMGFCRVSFALFLVICCLVGV
jgi:hypothetical protein